MKIFFQMALFIIFCISFISCASKPLEGEFSSEREKGITKQQLIYSLDIDYGILQLVDEDGNIIPLEMYNDETSILEVAERTDEIPIRDDLPFGVIIDLSNLPSRDFNITWMTEFPEPGLYDSETGEYVKKYTENVKIDNYNCFWWVFGSDELRFDGPAVGRWYFRFYYKDELIYIKSFHLYEENSFL